MKRRLRQVVLVLLALALGGFGVAASGIIPVKASSGHWPITEWFLKFAMRRSIATHSLGVEVPGNLGDRALVLKGAAQYELACRSCHGAPGRPLPTLAQAMLPRPPELSARVQASNPKKLFHVVKHGLKFTGMPAWPAPQRDDEVWAMVAFLLALPAMDAAEYRELAGDLPDPMARPTPRTAGPAGTPPPAAIASCVRCHGVDGDGRGSAAFPVLAGQRREYLENSLTAYAQRNRHSGIMGPVATGLDDAIVREVAAYYAELKTPARPAVSSAPRAAATRDQADLVALGRKIAHEGIPGARVPACVECHGPNGRRVKDAYPTLAGQPADYLFLQLELFKAGHRGGSAYAHLMDEVAPRLTSDQMRAVAAYFESLPRGAE